MTAKSLLSCQISRSARLATTMHGVAPELCTPFRVQCELIDEIDTRDAPAWFLAASRTLTKTAINKVFEKVRETPTKMRLPEMLSRGNPVHRILCTASLALSITYRVSV